MMKPGSVRRVQDRIIYGPVASRRFGRSLGINLSGNGKYCSFNCPYCFRGFNEGRPNHVTFRRNLPSCQNVISAMEDWIQKEPLTDINDWTIAGNAEPTDNPDFPQVVKRLIELRNHFSPAVKITVLTNGMGLIPRLNPDHEDVKMALEMVDRPCLKLDSGVPDTWRKMAVPFGDTSFNEWFAAVNKIYQPYIQTMLVQGRIDNTTFDELNRLKECYQILNPRYIYLLTLNKTPADERLLPIPPAKMENIGRILDLDNTIGA